MGNQQLGHGITVVDTGLLRPSFDASYLLVEAGRAAFVDVGTSFSAPLLLAALEAEDVPPEAVEYVILTHVHLDHAGGAGALLERLPHARLVVHPRGAPHMIDPAKLWAGATAVYGEEAMRRSYGSVVPVAAARVLEAPDGLRLELGGRSLGVLDTPGHARHHICVWDEASRGVFAGDTFGLSYPELASERGPLILPTTTPVQFDPVALHVSIDRLLGLAPQAVYLTHYSRVGAVEALARELKSRIDALVTLAQAAEAAPDRSSQLRQGLAALALRWAREHGTPLEASRVLELLTVDVELNAQGLEAWLDRGRRRSGPPV